MLKNISILSVLLTYLFVFYPSDSYPQSEEKEGISNDSGYYGPQKKFSGSNAYVSASILATGYWVKVKIVKSGIYKITYQDLVDMGIPDPAHPHIFGNGGGMLPEANNIPHPDDLQEVPFWMNKGSDNVFNQSDYLLFYATGPLEWVYSAQDSMFIHKLHLYDDGAYYFITSNEETGRVISAENHIDSTPDYTTNTFDDYAYHEINKENLIHSGREWYEPLNTLESNRYDFTFPNKTDNSLIRIKVRVIARSSKTSYFRIEAVGTQLTPIGVSPVNIYSYTSAYAKAGIREYSLASPGEEIPIIISYNNEDQLHSRAWLDYINIQVRSNLKMINNEMSFRDIHSVSPGRISEFSLQVQDNNTRVWDITDIHKVRKIETRKEGSLLHFRLHTDTLKEFIAFSGTDFPSPELVKKNLPNQNLHGLPLIEMVIISPPDFLDQANELAEFHHSHDQMSVTVVTPAQIFNEFSSGSRDISAIRNFMKMFYDRAQTTEEKPRYLLLLGDGSFDNKDISEENTNFILTYQSPNSLTPTQSFVSDDFFGILDDNEGGVTGLVDIGIGRFPVSTPKEAQIIVDKIKRYTSKKAMGDWHNNICFVGDDEDNNIHMKDADKLASYIETNNPSYVVDKIYLDAYQQTSTANGARYPDVNKAINEKIERGMLIFNYVGHGNERGLAHENILGISDINSWTNTPRLPLFVTATCEFSRFDNVDIDANGMITPKTSAGEMVLLNPNGGGIALLTTTRLVYSSPNFELNQYFYKYIFSHNELNKPNTLGDALRLTKNASGSGINKRNFTLLGDPALRLAYPEYKIVTDSINGVPVTLPFDTLKALNLVTISGHVEDEAGTFLPEINGILFPSIFDKARNITTLGNDNTPTMTFTLQDNILFNGKAEIQNGLFHFTFIVPKDISYNIGYGKFNYYATLDNGYDAAGAFKDILVGGFSDHPTPDITGPEVKLFLNDTLFREGGLADENPVFLASIEDEGGINTVGNGIGHDIVAVLDDQETTPVILNNYFTYEMNSFRKGTIRYPFFNLSPGLHTIRFKVWDNYNNSSEATLSFHVNKQQTSTLENIRNYPNPFHDKTFFTFDHNLSDNELNIQIRIFNLSGHLIRILTSHQWADGYTIDPIRWDGTNADGEKAAAGIYVFQVIIRSMNGTQVNGSGKLIIIH